MRLNLGMCLLCLTLTQSVAEQEVTVLTSYDHAIDLADGATARDEPLGFVIGIAAGAAAEEASSRFREMRETGELDEMISRMRLE